MNISEEEIQSQIESSFAQNLEALKMEGGHALSADLIQSAKNQVLLYWRKLRDVALKVTETEVKLNLPFQKTPRGRSFGIEGIVDIVRSDERTIMYDIKTYDADYVRANLEDFSDQLNVYAHIWKTLRGQSLDETAIIATEFPESVKEALKPGREASLDSAVQKWNPLVEIPFEPEEVADTISQFACIVDQIEDRQFTPAPLEKLKENMQGSNSPFGVRVCRNCDARFSCPSYRRYASASSSKQETLVRQYFQDLGPDSDEQDWLNNNLESQPENLV